MFGFHRKSYQPKLTLYNCTHCEYYAELKESDKLLPNKTVVRGKIVGRQCRKGNFELEDLNICPMFSLRPPGNYQRAYIPLFTKDKDC